VKEQKLKRVAVVGAGTMGHAIAQVFAHAGVEVGLVDLREEMLLRALRLVASNLRTLAHHGGMDSSEIPAILGRIHPTTSLAEAAGSVDFALEAVSEAIETKKTVFRQLEDLCPPHAILASNTSSLDVFRIVDLRNPARLVVAHWFAPPHIIPLVEVVPGPQTAPETVAFTAAILERIGKRPLVMKQFVPSFIVNRIQNAMVTAALELMENGWATPQEIDMAVKNTLGIRLPVVGVAQSLDFTGLKLVSDIREAAGKPVPTLIQEKIRQGHLGAATSRGLYDYAGQSEEEILAKRDRMYLRNLEHLDRIGAFEPV
jgi:3-hydroxybutyryl-CoA dehydrogenase